ncbi:MAG: DUF4339 domain-containing protein [Myxococcales bacterium]|nr:DUF4339 domain-containing protein [Myxococcales bacterium]MCB9577693.1 DUF4339 domain-containing protein [Polyangiaceae bacterium]
MTDWLVRELGSEPIGPYTTEDIVRSVEDGRMGVDWEVSRAGEDNWLPIEMVPEFADLAFVDGMTRITESPWFEGASNPFASAPNGPPPPALDAPPPPAAGAPPPPVSRPGPPPLPSRKRPGPPPVAPPVMPEAGSHGYDEDDDDVMTHVVAPPSETMGELTAVRAPPSELLEAARKSYDNLDETMTRVAVRPSPAAAPAPQKPFGVLPTLNMDRRELLPTGDMPSFPQPKLPPFPEPSAAAPPEPSYGPPPVEPSYGPPPVEPSYGPPPAQQSYGPAPVQQSYGYPPTPPPPAVQPKSDAGIKLLIVLIVLLAMGLTVVLVLLIARQ